jgi:hypothetical protein
MIFPGTLFITDSKDLISAAVFDPNKRQRCMVLDLDETSDELKSMFPNDAIKGTVLLPPPSAIFLQIDGDQEGFIFDYEMYLRSNDVVDYISTIIFMIYSGINTLIYIPSYSEDSVWVNVLLGFFEKEFGIHIGTSVTNGFSYNGTQDHYISNLMYDDCKFFPKFLIVLLIFYN